MRVRASTVDVLSTYDEDDLLHWADRSDPIGLHQLEQLGGENQFRVRGGLVRRKLQPQVDGPEDFHAHDIRLGERGGANPRGNQVGGALGGPRGPPCSGPLKWPAGLWVLGDELPPNLDKMWCWPG